MCSRTKFSLIFVCFVFICVNGIIVKDNRSEVESTESKDLKRATSYILSQTGDNDAHIIYLNGTRNVHHFDLPKRQIPSTLRPKKHQRVKFPSEFMRLANENRSSMKSKVDSFEDSENSSHKDRYYT